MELRNTEERRQRSSPRGSPIPSASMEGRRARPSQEQGNDRKRIKTELQGLDEVFNIVVAGMRAEWRELGRKLGLTHNDIEATDQKHREDPTECCREVLEMWRRHSGSEATLGKLAEALRNARRVDLAEIIERRGADSDSRIVGKQSAPRNVRVVKTTESWIMIEWTPPATCEDGMIIGYKVERCLAKTDEWVQAHELDCLPSTTKEFKVGGLTKRNQYYFRVRSVYGGCLLSDPSYSSLGIAKKQGQPLPPRNLRVTDRDIERNTVSLEWLEPEDAGENPITLYIVEKYLRFNWNKCLETSELQCTVNDIKSGCRLRVSAKNSKDLQSDPSEMVDPEIRMRVEIEDTGQANREAVENALWKSAFDPQGLSGKKIEDGSIVFVYSCSEPIGLCNLWRMYCRGEVCQYFQKLLVTDDVLRACAANNIKLGVTIEPEDFRASCYHLLMTRECENKQGYRVLSNSIDTGLLRLVDRLASIKGKTAVLTQGETIGHLLDVTSKTSRSTPRRAKKHNPSSIAPAHKGVTLY